MKLKWDKWFYTLLQTVIGGVASSGSAWLGTLIGNQVDASIQPLDLKQFGLVLVTSTLLHLFFFLKASPLPPEATGNTETITKDASRLSLWLLCGFLSVGFIGCMTPERFEAGGAYAASATQAAQPELYAIDASFDMAYSALDATFKYERDNRKLLWQLSPSIKKGLDKIRKEAGTVRDDYALARTIYLENPTPAGLDELRTQLGKLTNANKAALAVIETKGNQ